MPRNNRVSEWAGVIAALKVARVGDSILIRGISVALDRRREQIKHIKKLCNPKGIKVRFWRQLGVQYVRLEGRFQVVTTQRSSNVR